MPSVDRREFLILCSAAIAAACDKPALPTPTRAIAEAPADPRESWRAISPGDRLRGLETRQFPKFNGFSLIPEISLATAQLRCQITTCNRGVAEMEQAVKVLSAVDFSKAYERVHGIKPEQHPKGGVVLEFAEGEPLHTIYLNTDAIKLMVSLMSPQTLATYRQNNTDPEIAFIKQAIIYAQSHLNQTQEKLLLNQPVKVQLPYSSQFATVSGMDALSLKVLDPYNNSVMVPGIRETLTEIATEFICSKAGTYTLLPPARYGVDLIKPLFNLAGINTEDALAVFHGRKKQTELMTWLGSIQKGPNALERNTLPQEMGLKVLAIIGLTVDSVIPRQVAPGWIEEMYGRRIYGQPTPKPRSV